MTPLSVLVRRQIVTVVCGFISQWTLRVLMRMAVKHRDKMPVLSFEGLCGAALGDRGRVAATWVGEMTAAAAVQLCAAADGDDIAAGAVATCLLLLLLLLCRSLYVHAHVFACICPVHAGCCRQS